MRISKPVFIIGSARSGTTLLYTILKASSEFYSAPTESHTIWTKFLANPKDWMFSNIMKAEDFQDSDIEYLTERYSRIVFSNGFMNDLTLKLFFNRYKPILEPFFALWSNINSIHKKLCVHTIRVLDKTPPNTYRIEYLAKAFPDAHFIYITRDGITNISSLMDGWRAKQKFSFAFREQLDLNIDGYSGKIWKFTNPPGWENYTNKTLEEVCAFQWLSSHEHALNSFEKLETHRWTPVKYEDLVANPEKVIRELCMFIDIPYEGKLKALAEKPPVVSTNTKPDPNKWQKNKDRLEKIKPMIAKMQEKLGYSKANLMTH